MGNDVSTEVKTVSLNELIEAIKKAGEMSPEAKKHIYDGGNNSLADFRAGQEAAREDMAKDLALFVGGAGAAVGLGYLIWSLLKKD